MEDGVLGKANKDGSIHVNKDVTDPEKIKEVVAHEAVHIDQMKRGDLDYTDNKVIWKGKEYSRKSMDEGAKNLPWEKEAYSRAKENKFKLNGYRGNSNSYNLMQNKGLINKSPLDIKLEESKKIIKKEVNEPTVGLNYRTAEPAAKKIIKKAEPTVGKDIKVNRPSIQSKKAPSWTDNYTSVTYATKGGKGIRRYAPNSNVVGGSVRYYDISQKNPDASMTEINQKQFVNLLSKGDKPTGQKYTKMNEDDIVTGGNTEVLKELRSQIPIISQILL